MIWYSFRCHFWCFWHCYLFNYSTICFQKVRYFQLFNHPTVQLIILNQTNPCLHWVNVHWVSAWPHGLFQILFNTQFHWDILNSTFSQQSNTYLDWMVWEVALWQYLLCCQLSTQNPRAQEVQTSNIHSIISPKKPSSTLMLRISCGVAFTKSTSEWYSLLWARSV